MRRIYHHDSASLYYCSQTEYEICRKRGTSFSALFCAKNPYHQWMVGYVKNCSKDHPEYLVARRPKDRMMALNMVDAPKPEFFSDEMIMAGIDFIENELAQGHDVVVVCNQGESRSPTMCLMYMMVHGDFDKSKTFDEVCDIYRVMTNYEWNPNMGIFKYCQNLWEKLRKEN